MILFSTDRGPPFPRPSLVLVLVLVLVLEKIIINRIGRMGRKMPAGPAFSSRSGSTRPGDGPERLLARLGGSLALHISPVLVDSNSWGDSGG
jgi:hypothetical protein